MIDICHIKHWQLPSGKREWIADDSETGGHWGNVIPVQKSLYGLLHDHYGWILPDGVRSASSSWTYEDHKYVITLDPFYLNSNGSVYGDGRPNELAQSANEGTYWTRSKHEMGAYLYEHGETSPGAGVFVLLFSNRRPSNGYSLRCLTQ